MLGILFLIAPLVGAMLGTSSNSSDEEEEESSKTITKTTYGYDPFQNKTWIFEQKWKIKE